jgi:hypothetical protein
MRIVLILLALSLSTPAQTYDCTEYCSGHEAGYRWAEEHGITNADDCGGNSESFIEGCVSYVEEYAAAHDADDRENEEDEEGQEEGEAEEL